MPTELENLKAYAEQLRQEAVANYRKQIDRFTSQINGEYQYDDAMRYGAEQKRAVLQNSIDEGLLTGACTNMQRQMVQHASEQGMTAHAVTMRYSNGQPIHELTILEMPTPEGGVQRFLFDPSMRQFEPSSEAVFKQQQKEAISQGIAAKEELAGYRLRANPETQRWYEDLLRDGVVPFDDKMAQQYLEAFNQPEAAKGAQAVMERFIPAGKGLRAQPLNQNMSGAARDAVGAGNARKLTAAEMAAILGEEADGTPVRATPEAKPSPVRHAPSPTHPTAIPTYGEQSPTVLEYRFHEGEVPPVVREPVDWKNGQLIYEEKTLTPIEAAVRKGYSSMVYAVEVPREAAAGRAPMAQQQPLPFDAQVQSVPTEQAKFLDHAAAKSVQQLDAAAVAEHAMAGLSDAEKIAVRTAAVGGEVGALARIGRGLGSKLPLIGVGLAGAYAAYVVLHAEQGHKEGKLNAEQLAAIIAGGATYTGTQAGSIFTGFAGEEGVEATLKALHVPQEYRFGTLRETLVGLVKADTEIAYHMRDLPASEVAALQSALAKLPDITALKADTQSASFNRLVADLKQVREEAHSGKVTEYSASSGVMPEYTLPTADETARDRDTALRRYLVTGGSVAEVNVLAHGASFEVGDDVIKTLQQSKVVMAMGDGSANTKADGKLDLSELRAVFGQLKLGVADIDPNRDFVATAGEVIDAIASRLPTKGGQGNTR